MESNKSVQHNAIVPHNMKNGLTIHYVPVTSLNPSVYNPRTWSTAEIQTLKSSIEKYGLCDPLIANSFEKRKGVLIGGHFRYQIACEMGFTEVPVVFLNIPEMEREKELNLLLNRSHGSWDWDKLIDNYCVEDLVGAGFDEVDLGKYWNNELGVEDDNFDVDKAIDEVKKNPIAKLGDLFQLGNHRVICGDCTDPAVVKKLAGDIKVSYINSDSPYNIKLDYSKGVGNKGKYGGIEKDNRTDEAFLQMLKSSLENALSVATTDVHILYWCDEKYVWLVQGLFKGMGVKNERLCIWIKNNQSVTPKSAFNKMTEYCCYGTRGKPFLNESIRNLNEIQNKEIATGNRSADDIMDLLNIWLVDRLPATEYVHPTMKPPTLYEKAMRRCTKVGDYILDSYGGSGSQLIAAEQLKRRALLIEIDPVFVDLILYRYEQFTGIKPVKLS